MTGHSQLSKDYEPCLVGNGFAFPSDPTARLLRFDISRLKDENIRITFFASYDNAYTAGHKLQPRQSSHGHRNEHEQQAPRGRRSDPGTSIQGVEAEYAMSPSCN
jgi:hypothetical protein